MVIRGVADSLLGFAGSLRPELPVLIKIMVSSHFITAISFDYLLKAAVYY